MYDVSHRFAQALSEAIPDPVIEHVLRGIVVAYRLGFEHCEGTFSEGVARQDFPNHRRDRIEDMLLGIGNARFPGIVAEHRPNRLDTAKHACIVGGAALLTVHAVVGRRELPRDTHFGGDYASTQLDLFDRRPSRSLYGTLIHGPRDEFRPYPEFVGIGFPDREFKKWEHFIDLSYTIPQIRGIAPASLPAPAKVALVALKKPEEKSGA